MKKRWRFYKKKEQQPQQEQILKQQPTKPIRMEQTEPQRVPTARELLEASYAEIRRAKHQWF